MNTAPRRPPHHTLLPAALLAALLTAPQAWADSGGVVWTDGTLTYYHGKNGASDNSAAKGNEDVTVTNQYNGAYGGISDSDYNINPGATEASNNALILQIGAEVGGAYGGRMSSNASATASGNTVTLDGGLKVTDLYGGAALGADATANDNTVRIQSGKTGTGYGYMVGGWAGPTLGSAISSAAASGNTVSVEGGEFGGDLIYGGRAYAPSGTAAASNNTVMLNGGSFTWSGTLEIYGGWASAPSATATDNTIVLGAKLGKDALKNAQLYGGYASVVGGNTLKVQRNGLTAGGIQNFEFYEFAPDALDSGGTAALTLNSQSASIAFSSSSTEKVRIGHSNGLGMDLGDTATLLERKGGTGVLSGSDSFSTTLDDAGALPVASYTLSSLLTVGVGIKVSELYLYGDGGDPAENTTGQREKGNSLTLAGGTATAAFGGRASNDNATDNILTIDGAATLQTQAGNALSGNAYGGYADTGDATDNTVILTRNMAGKTADFGIYGGASGSGGEATSGNTLLVQASDVTVQSINNFENLRFTLPAGTTAGDTVLTTRAATDLDGANITIGGSVPALAPGETITLISSTSGTPAASSTVPGGFTLDASGGALVLKAQPPQPQQPRQPYVISDTPTMGALGLLLSGIALAGAAAPALRRREKHGKKANTRQ